MKQHSKTLRRLIVTLVGLMGACLAGTLIIGGLLAAPQLRPIGAPPTDLAVEAVQISGPRGRTTAGWFIPGVTGEPGILLLHSVRSSRKEMLGRARFLNAAGYSILAIDMQAHGETPGEHITFGFREADDAHSALLYLRHRIDGPKVGVIGVSLGGAAALLGEAPVPADAVVLEAVYSGIDAAIVNRLTMRLGWFGKLLAPLLIWQIEPRLDVPVTALSPLAAITDLSAPVFIIAGNDDLHTLRHESEALYAAAPGPKALWLIDGAEHEDLHRHSQTLYEQKVLEFFALHLRASKSDASTGRAPWRHEQAIEVDTARSTEL